MHADETDAGMCFSFSVLHENQPREEKRKAFSSGVLGKKRGTSGKPGLNQ